MEQNAPDDDWADLIRPDAGAATDDDPAAGARWTPSPATSLRPGRRRVLLALAGLPWVGAGVGLAVARGTRTPGPDLATAAPAPSATGLPTGEAGAVRALPAPTVVTSATVPGPEMSEAPHIGGTDRRLESVALLAAHTHVRDRGDYADHAAVEQVRHPRRDAAVVVVVVSVLQSQGAGWSEPRIERLAVPLRFAGADPVVATAPWPLPLAAPAPAPSPDLLLIDDPALLDGCAAALRTAGWSDVSVQGASSDGGWPLVVDVVAAPPGLTGAAALQVWCEPSGPGWRLVGDTATAPPAPTTPAPSPPPSEPSEGTTP